MHVRSSLLALAPGVVFSALALRVPAQSPSSLTTEAAVEGAAEVRAMIDDGRYACAEERARDLVERSSAASLDSSREGSELLRLLARAMWLDGKQKEAETRALCERSLRTAVQVAGEPSREAADARFDLGILSFIVGDYSLARDELEQALAQKDALLGLRHPEVAKILVYLGYLAYEENRDIHEAKRLFARARDIQDATLAPDDLDVALRLGREANVEAAAKDWAGARRDHERALVIYERRLRPDHPLIAVEHHNTGSLCWNLCDWPGAAAHLERALALRRSELGEEHVNVASTMALLAQVRGYLGDPEGALTLWQGSLERFEKALGPRDPQLLLPLRGLTTVHLAAGDPAAAEKDLARMRSIARETSLAGREDLASLEGLEAELAAMRGESHATLAHLRRGLELIADLPDSDLARAELLRAIGVQLGSSPVPSEIAEGVAALEQALALTRPSYPAGCLRPAWILDGLAAALSRACRNEEAFARALEAGAIAREHLRSTASRFEERSALGDAAHSIPGLPLALSIAAREPAPGRVAKAWDALIGSRSLVFEEMRARQRLARLSTDPKIGALARTLADARERYADLAVRGEADPSRPGWRDILDGARAERERAERALADATAQARGPVASPDAGCAALVNSLPAGVALVSFARVSVPDRATSEYVAFLWPPGARDPAIRSLGDAAAIDEDVGKTLSACRSAVRESEYRRVASRLRERIWDPLGLDLSGAREICVVPDGALVLVDFSALPVGDRAYLIDRTPPIHYLSTERDLVPEEAPPGRGLLACGGPDLDHLPMERIASFDAQGTDLLAFAGASAIPTVVARGPEPPASARLSDLRFGPLPGAAEEARRIAEIWSRVSNQRPADGNYPSDVVRLTDAEAGEEAFARLAPGRAVLHLATHGFFLPADETQEPHSARGGHVPQCAVLSPAFDLTLASDHSLLSGLAFAGANRHATGDGRRDGLLLAEEICALDLSGVRLAVLSACDTGLGQVQAGEGVFGLRRAFRLAGVRTLVTSLWPVDDRTTERRMAEFYERWLGKGEGVAEALRSSALSLLRDRRARGEDTHPYSWAGFVAVGGRDCDAKEIREHRLDGAAPSTSRKPGDFHGHGGD